MFVKYVNENGYVYFDFSGLIDERALLSTKLDICTEKGIYTGVVGVKNRHLMTAEDLKRPITLSELCRRLLDWPCLTFGRGNRGQHQPGILHDIPHPGPMPT
jgi:hypothetical protein